MSGPPVILIRALLIVQAVGAAMAAVALAVFMMLVLAFGAFVVGLFALLGLLALIAAIAIALIGQQRLAAGDPRWRLGIIWLEVLVVVAGISLEAYLLLPTLRGVPAPPALNVALVLVLPAIAVVNLALLLAMRAPTFRHDSTKAWTKSL